jgi:LPXTG-motif cell wall-anchored protein
MNRLKRTGVLTLLTVMLLSMAVFSSPALANGEPAATPTPTATPATATKTLTPEGNLTLVDDISGTSSDDKQFITVVTKNGNYFYIIIDRASESENVYFLNKVDEADLMEILEEAGYEIEVTPTPTLTTRPTVDPDSVSDTNNSKSNAPLILITLLIAGGIGAIIFFKKKKASSKAAPRMEDFDYEYDDEDEEEIEEEKPPVCNEAVQKKGKWDGVL